MERFIASNATVIGDVTLSEDVTIWYQAVLRGDSNWIKIGQRTNIQDGTIIHVDHDAPVDIAENVTVRTSVHATWLYNRKRGADRDGDHDIELCGYW